MRRGELFMMICWSALVAGPGCARVGFENRTHIYSSDARPGDLGPVVWDSSKPSDLLPRLDGIHDLPAPLPRLVCASPAVISQPGLILWETTISVDGLTIYANDVRGIFRAKRAVIGAAFGLWTFQGAPDGYIQDPDLFLCDGKEVSVTADDDSTSPLRYLQLCDGAFSSCQRIEVFDVEQQKLITVDMDGPSVANIGGKLLMVFNVQPGALETTDIFLGTPRDPKAPLLWDVRRVDHVNSPDLKDDDPAISSDGRILIFSVRVGGAPNMDLVASYRADLSQPFSIPEVVANLNSEEGEHGPELFTRPSGEIEIYFNRYTVDSSRINRSLCTLR